MIDPRAPVDGQIINNSMSNIPGMSTQFNSLTDATCQAQKTVSFLEPLTSSRRSYPVPRPLPTPTTSRRLVALSRWVQPSKPVRSHRSRRAWRRKLTSGSGMVLVLSVWDDYDVSMLWLDSDYPTTASPSAAGVNRGPCSTSSGKPSDVESSQAK
jgi:hypothetical protein